MRKFSLMFLLLIGLLPSQVYAQTGTPSPKLPVIFVDGIQVEQLQVPVTVNQSLYDIVWQNKTIQIRAALDAEWQSFPFPDDIEPVECMTLRSDGLWTVQARCFGMDIEPEPASLNTVRLLDPVTGIYTIPETICDGQLKASAGEGVWVYVIDPKSQLTGLCFTENGELRGNLPVNIHWNDQNSPDLSLNKDYLVLQGDDDHDEQKNTIHFYSYRLIDNQIISLGTVDLATAGVRTWFDSTRGIISGTNGFDGYPEFGFELYRFDVTQPESIEYGFWNFESKVHMLYFDEEAERYESVSTYRQITSETGSRGEFVPCTLSLLDAESAASYILGNHCVLLPYRGEDAVENSYTNAYRAANRYYYLAAKSEESTLSRLMYFDLADLKVYDTGHYAEIDSISSISPDGRYVVLEYGEDRILNNLQHCCTSGMTGWAGIYDLEQGKIIYISDPATNIRSVWLDSETVLVVSDSGFRGIRADEETGDVFYIGVSGFRRIMITNDDADPENVTVTAFTSTTFPVDDFRLNDLSADHRYMLSEYGVIDLETFKFIPIVKSDVASNQFNFEWEDNTLLALVWDGGQELQYRVVFN
ncbi:MAG TPA: hypothetical protein VHL11_25060 [Phototrophicaceae bacterium]|nr:hypothetical protein [Phototrophicaceae bacterium]